MTDINQGGYPNSSKAAPSRSSSWHEDRYAMEVTAGVGPMANMNELENVASEKFIHLTTTGRKTGKPRMVELWFAVNGDRVYLSHEGEETDWMKNIKKNEQVTFEIGGKNFTGKARYLKDRDNEAWTAKVALYEKYYGKASKEVIEDWFSLSKLLLIDDVCPVT